MTLSNVLATGSILVWATAWAATENKSPVPPVSGVEVTANEHTKMYAELAFANGSARLNSASREKLDNLLRGAKSAGEIAEVRVISWADAAYPAQENAELPREQRELAAKRNETIETALKKKNVSTKVYNMAEKPSALADLFSTSDARMKEALQQAGITGAGHDKISRSMVLVILKN